MLLFRTEIISFDIEMKLEKDRLTILYVRKRFLVETIVFLFNQEIEHGAVSNLNYSRNFYRDKEDDRRKQD